MITVVEGRPTVSGQPGGWLGAVDPTDAEVARLVELGIPRDLVAHALDPDERPRVVVDERTTFVVIRVPHPRGPSAETPYTTVPLGLVLADSWVAAICRGENEVVQRLRAFAESDWPVGKQHRFVLHALAVAAEAFLEHLSCINEQVDALEKRLQHSLANREVVELLRYQKSLVYFATSLRANELVAERLQKSALFKVPPEEQALLDDVLVELRQAIDVTSMAGNILGEMMDAFASIVSNNLNCVMKLLAGVAVVLTVPLTVSSFYGMNVALPGQHSPLAFVASVTCSLAGSALVAVFFRSRNWL